MYRQQWIMQGYEVMGSYSVLVCKHASDIHEFMEKSLSWNEPGVGMRQVSLFSMIKSYL